MYVTMLNWDVELILCGSEVTDIDYYSFLCPSLVHVHRITQLQSSCATHNQTHREEARIKLRSIHTNRSRLQFFITTNGLCRIQCKCWHGTITTMTQNVIQPICLNCTMWIDLKMKKFMVWGIQLHGQILSLGFNTVSCCLRAEECSAKMKLTFLSAKFRRLSES